ncbi:nucleotidyltransferase domain-containing protein [Mycolicibacterium sp. PAM1]|uniref:Aminoglycoside nucleotidyltransferase n=1 Tax=Mycolicibacterium gilvum (strain PYR-GCK) TaxID=350054 RepID=A4TGI4_MYCGI|nr:aminoglycoside nucleotidyltransferase [Mycolicibacterium sp. PAM1]
MSSIPCMPSHEVIALYRDAVAAGVRLWVDGGWCVDALVGEQSREHNDLDVAVDRDDLDVLVVVLNTAGYRRQSTEGSTDWNFVMVDDIGRQVDIHVFHFDTSGRHVYGVEYPRESLQGSGFIDGEEVQCITARSMYQFKTAYEPAAKDRADIRQLRRLLS